MDGNKNIEGKQRYLNVNGFFILVVLIIITYLGWHALSANDEITQETKNIQSLPRVDSDTEINENAVGQALASSMKDLPIIIDTSLVPAPNPFTLRIKTPEVISQTYIVQRGDTPGTIAESFGIKTETLLGGNPTLSQESSLLQIDAEIIILPIDGVLHDVVPGETLESISTLYGIAPEEIISYSPNNLEFPYRLIPNTQILVPGAIREVFIWTPPNLSNTGSNSSQGSGVSPLIVGTGTYIYPVNSRNFTQFYWYGHRGIDIALPEGAPVYASDTGTVTFANYDTWGYGNLIVLNHGNGFETFYAHLSAVNVSPGQIVNQGNLIGSTGNSGNSSGPHIHFEVRLNGNPDDPCWYLRGGC